jgi:hypothetical protein
MKWFLFVPDEYSCRCGTGRASRTVRRGLPELSLLIFPGPERRWHHGVLNQSLGIDMRMGAYHHLANATLVACFFAAMLVSAHLFTEYRSMKAPSLGIVRGKMLPL